MTNGHNLDDGANYGVVIYALPFSLAGSFSGFFLPRFSDDSARLLGLGVVFAAVLLVCAAIGFWARGFAE